MNIIKPGKEDVPPDQLTIEHIRKLVVGFNEMYEAGAAYKGYEFQMVEVLVARIDELEKALGIATEWYSSVDDSRITQQAIDNMRNAARKALGL